MPLFNQEYYSNSYFKIVRITLKLFPFILFQFFYSLF